MNRCKLYLNFKKARAKTQFKKIRGKIKIWLETGLQKEMRQTNSQWALHDVHMLLTVCSDRWKWLVLRLPWAQSFTLSAITKITLLHELNCYELKERTLEWIIWHRNCNKPGNSPWELSTCKPSKREFQAPKIFYRTKSLDKKSSLLWNLTCGIQRKQYKSKLILIHPATRLSISSWTSCRLRHDDLDSSYYFKY